MIQILFNRKPHQAAMLLLLSCLVASLAKANTVYTLSQDDILYFYDGDTFYIRCDRCQNGKLAIRPKNYDAPEIKGKCDREKRLARQAKQTLVQLVRQSQIIELIPDPTRPYDQWGRLLADIYLDGLSLATTMINAGVARKYEVGKPYSWC